MMDIASILISSLMGLLGWHVTLHPPTRRKRLYYSAFMLLALTGVVLGITQSRRSGRTLESIERNTAELATFHLETPQPGSPIEAGQRCLFAVNFRNGGPVPTIGNGKIATQCFLTPLRLTAREQANVMQEFENYWLDSKQIWDMPSKEPNAVGMSSTNLGPFYSEDDVTGIKSGIRRIYIVTRFAFADKYNQRTQTLCLYSGSPQRTTAGLNIDFHDCAFGNSHIP